MLKLYLKGGFVSAFIRMFKVSIGCMTTSAIAPAKLPATNSFADLDQSKAAAGASGCTGRGSGVAAGGGVGKAAVDSRLIGREVGVAAGVAAGKRASEVSCGIEYPSGREGRQIRDQDFLNCQGTRSGGGGVWKNTPNTTGCHTKASETDGRKGIWGSAGSEHGQRETGARQALGRKKLVTGCSATSICIENLNPKFETHWTWC